MQSLIFKGKRISNIIYVNSRCFFFEETCSIKNSCEQDTKYISCSIKFDFILISRDFDDLRIHVFTPRQAIWPNSTDQFFCYKWKHSPLKDFTVLKILVVNCALIKRLMSKTKCVRQGKICVLWGKREEVEMEPSTMI